VIAAMMIMMIKILRKKKNQRVARSLRREAPLENKLHKEATNRNASSNELSTMIDISDIINI
jgi:hypothetical protein